MALVDSLRTTTVRPTRLVAALHVLIATFGIALGNLTASPSPPAPASDELPLLTVSTERTHTFIVNGAFGDDGSQSHTYSAFQTNGDPLPSWVSLDEKTGVFQIKAPSAATGSVLTFYVLATHSNGERAIETFDLVVDDVSLGCSIEANADGLARMLECGTGKTKLRGYSAGGSYKWKGPNGFSSTEKEPTVVYPGLYVLTASGCNRTQAVVVRSSEGGCNTVNKNQIPVARIDADQFSGNAPLTVNFDALLSGDPDGKIIEYSWSWGDVTAAGPTPTATFPEGKHEVVLTVTDNTGAKSTDYVTVEVNNPGYVRYREFWLEAECAVVGSNWVTENSSEASGGRYAYSKSTSLTNSPADIWENRVRFEINNAEKGSYNLFARVQAKDGSTNSFWVRVNGKEWVMFNGLRTGAFQWNEMSDYQPYLNDGANVIDFAFREPNARLDNIHLDKSQTLPSGFGNSASNCMEPANLSPNAVAQVSATSGIAPLTVTFDGSSSSDPDGTINEYRWAWNGGSKVAKTASMTLPAGHYDVTLTVTDNDGATSTDGVIIQVEDPVVDGRDAIWLEAECSIAGTAWTKKKSSSASNGEYMVVTNQDSYNNPPADIKDNRVRFIFEASESGNYSLFALINAPTNLDDSFWVRANGGSWIKWYSGIEQGRGWQWNLLSSKLYLRPGANTVDFAFRESGTMLDKIFLTTTNTKPSGMGSTAINCGGEVITASQPSTEYHEAECATTGSVWQSVTSSDASGGTYMLATGQDYFMVPGYDNDMMKFRAYAAGSGTFKLHLRVDVTVGTNSCWIKVDNGPWVIFSTKADGGELLTKGFEWHLVTIEGSDFNINVNAGYHEITIAKRHAEFKLDKVLLSRSETIPSGHGGSPVNCDNSSMAMGAPAMLKSTDDAPLAAEFTDGVTLYPNPVVDRVNLVLKSAYTGPVDLSIVDVNGRELQSSKQEKEAEQFTVDFNVSDLPPGVYNVQIIEGEQRSVQSFVKQ